jgi:hypothetical protein
MLAGTPAFLRAFTLFACGLFSQADAKIGVYPSIAKKYFNLFLAFCG